MPRRPTKSVLQQRVVCCLAGQGCIHAGTEPWLASVSFLQLILSEQVVQVMPYLLQQTVTLCSDCCVSLFLLCICDAYV